MLAVRLPESLENELNLLSKQTSKTKTEIVKDALKLFFETKAKKEQKTAYELGKDIFGRYGNGEGELSTTYKQKLKSKLHDKYHSS